MYASETAMKSPELCECMGCPLHKTALRHDDEFETDIYCDELAAEMDGASVLCAACKAAK